MPKQHIVHPNATPIMLEHRKLRNELRKLRGGETKPHPDDVRFLERAISFTGQVFNARISKKSLAAINLLG